MDKVITVNVCYINKDE